jgi:hypothetical protein
MMPANLSFKSIYVQTVQVSLEHLYMGVEKYKFDLVDNLWTRWRAAIRGKVVYLSLYQGLIYALPVLRASKFLAFCTGVVIVHSTLPKPDPEQRFESALPKGSKGGKTKVKFASTKFGVPEVVFEISEAPHEHYTRVDNDLHTSIRITKQEALTGCTKKLPSLNDDGKIEIVIQPNQIKTSGDTIRIQGQGWPVRNAPEVYLHGDLVARVQIVEKPKRKKQRKRTKDESRFE